MRSPYPRDLIGYGRNPPNARWPNQARIAVQFVLNYEEGGENCVLHGDAGSEQFLSEIVGAASYPARHMSMESIYEYGSRVGGWRILRKFEARGLPLTVFGVGMAMQRHPEFIQACQQLGHEIASHGWRWIHHQNMPIDDERAHIKRAVEAHVEVCGTAPSGWYTGRDSPNTRKLVVEHGGFEYDSDYYGDDLPFWTEVLLDDGRVKPHLVVPYTLDANDMRFATPQGFNTAEHFFQYLRDTFDALYAEGAHTPRMMSIGMHCRLLGRPGRIVALQKFLDYIGRFDRVWVCRRIDIARHWAATHPFVQKDGLARLSTLDQGTFVRELGDVFEHSPWIAEGAWSKGPFTSVEQLHAAMGKVLHQADAARRMALIRAHPELAGKAAIRGELTDHSRNEQQGVGLDACTPEEFAAIQELNQAYSAKFGFPFIVAVKDHTRESIIADMRRRISQPIESEVAEAIRQIERIAWFRLKSKLG